MLLSTDERFQKSDRLQLPAWYVAVWMKCCHLHRFSIFVRTKPKSKENGDVMEGSTSLFFEVVLLCYCSKIVLATLSQ